VAHSTCASSASWCPRTDTLFDVPKMHVLTVKRNPARFLLSVESDADVGGCPSCGVGAVGHGRRRRVVADAPCFGAPVRLVWLARLWRCREPACRTGCSPNDMTWSRRGRSSPPGPRRGPPTP